MIMANEKINSPARTTFKISNMVCEGCAEKITTALKALPGVKKVKSKVFKRQIQVNYYPEQIKQEELKKALEKEGYIADEV
jgi:copper chaperone CopZ